ncbi:putative lysosomal/endosomal membrane protein p67 [Trypanosoma cruzi]|uniref:Phospholipase B-like n=2 Tax=Trypanosoma cruzi TaxID=5693 RepID=Q4CNU0_TRYCC|nr:lysosomal/endosomal membrane protein p67, putative [Trypanosoma cruzi]EAN81944.1 lysosomal/endosomal membrane protein p67, putative [Trypanosoma cruzi]PWV03503.1 putative lysosomal/endosomal membrane protein p67 [Trypanosoma cruzi]|eukprot:XP_803464.1 lysosomal/endosomal membrane protein p67 [Trypanosoma cruzi strain CL Brener]
MRRERIVKDVIFGVTLLLLATAILATGGVRAEFWQNDDVTTVKVRYNMKTKEFSVTEGELFGAVAATLEVHDTFLQNGWDVVNAEADKEFLHSGPIETRDEMLRIAYQAMGYGEGYTTQKRMEAQLNNSFLGKGGLNEILASSPEAVKWIQEHVEYMDTADAVDAYGRQLKNLLALLDGMVAGYNARVGAGGVLLNRTWLFYLNFLAEIGDVVASVSSQNTIAGLRETNPRHFLDLHCSALVKVTEYDIYFSHATWSSFNSMLRQYKTYRVEHRTVTMSSYPGMIHSIDDWYMTSERLAVMETTNGIYNDSLYAYLNPKTVSEFLRVMIANFLATDSPSWVKYFSLNNSGTYNNQWMVLNMAAVANPKTPMPANTFWVAEQLPGSTYPLGVTAADMTEHLNKYGYWASYNIPYFENVYEISGYLKKEKEFGDYFSYTNCSRAKMFKRNESDVVSLESMKRLMRYNNYKEDNLSLIQNCTGAGMNDTCNPPFSAMLTIASRGDLNPAGDAKNYGPLYEYLGRRDHGATDAKIATWSGMVMDLHHYTSHVICGPTNEQQPTFEWKDDLFTPMPPTYGLPKVYNFTFMKYVTNVSPKSPSIDNARNKWVGIAVSTAAAALVFVSIAIVLVRSRRRAKYLHEDMLLAH